MRVYRPLLVALTLLVSVLISSTLLSSWTEPQPQGQLNLYQSDLLLHASEWQQLSQAGGESADLRNALLGGNAIQDALKNYEAVRTSAQADLDKLNQIGRKPSALPSQSKPPNPLPLGPTLLVNPPPALEPTLEVDPVSPTVQKSVQETRGQLIDELDLRLGLLYIQTEQQAKSLQTWEHLISNPQAQGSLPNRVKSAQVLQGLWSEPPQILPNAEPILTQSLMGWFRFQALSRLYTLQQRQDTLLDLKIAEQKTARSAFTRLLMVSVMPVLGSLVGIAILLVWGIRTLLSRQADPSQAKVVQSAQVPRFTAPVPHDEALLLETRAINPSSLLAETSLQETVLWPQETIWQVMVLWFTAFFGMSVFFVPLMVSWLKLKPELLDGRLQTYLALFSYISLMVVGFGILQVSLSRFTPSFLRWLKLKWSGNWFLWGLGGYFVALPLVLLVSLLNQQILRDQGGGNPILDIILQSHDPFTVVLLWFLVAVCAPLFEETLFRGFFLTSLTRYIPAWQAVGLSGLVFAIAHLNLGDLLPLTLLGMVLGFVYLRSRNLLTSMLLHSLWNSGSFMGLLILGSGS